MSSKPRLLFLVPAHNEHLLISRCVGSLRRMGYPPDKFKVTVIADNCTDDTPVQAADAGAEVMVRVDTVRRGKSAAIDWALTRIDLSQWDAVVILDGDSEVEPAFASALATFAPLGDKVVQTYNGMFNEFESWLTRLSGVLTRIRYDISFPKKQERRLNVPLAGNGLCIGTGILQREGWRAESITEGWEMYARWTAAGVRIGYAQGARLYSQEASSLRQSRTQRERWASGRAEIFRKWRGAILKSTLIGMPQKLDALWTLGAPSPMVGALLALALAMFSLVVLPEPAARIAAGVAIGTQLPWLVAVVRVLWNHPQRLRTILSFAMVPPYALWRGALQVRAIVVGTKGGWVRTARK